MGSPRSLVERLEGARRAAPRTLAPSPGSEARPAILARWFGAHLAADPDGSAVLVERRVSLTDETLAALDGGPAAAYFDTETTGLSTGAGTVVFLAGLARIDDGQLLVRQWLLPDYPHEVALLRHVIGELAEHGRLVTYNGRSFDVPMLAARLTFHGLFRQLATLPERHDDLLPPARRLFRRVLGGARLALVEAGVLGVERTGDCPGSEVPARYFGYLSGESPDVLAAVLDHNLQDVVSLALLDAELTRLRAGGWRTADVLDRHGMAMELLRLGEQEQALELLETTLAGPADSEEAFRIRRVAGRLLIGRGEVDRAEELWTDSTRRASPDAATAWLEIARIRERHRSDLRGALSAAQAAGRVLDIAFALGRGGSMAAVARVRLRVDARLRRLHRWVKAAERRAAAADRRVATPAELRPVA